MGDYDKAALIMEENIEKSFGNKDLYINFLLELAQIYIIKCSSKKLYSVYERLAKIEPEMSFEDMLNDLKEFDEKQLKDMDNFDEDY